MKILHISAYALRGGCEKNCYHFIKEATEHEHTIIVLGVPGPMSPEWTALGVKVTHINSLVVGIPAFRSLLKQSIEGKFDLAICWSTIRLPVQLNVLKQHVPKVKVHLGNPLGSNYITLKDRVLSALLPPPADVELIACSKYTGDTYRSNGYYRRFPLRVSLNPVALPSSIRRSPPANVMKIGMVARLDPIKDHKTIIRGFKILSRAFPSLTLELVGDGICRNELTQLVADLSLDGKVTFHGDVKDVYSYLEGWNVFVYATTPSEGLGSAVAEALVMGLPCVLSDLPMLREVAPGEGQALWFPAGDENKMAMQVTSILNDKIVADRLSQAALAHGSHAFSPRRFVNEYLS